MASLTEAREKHEKEKRTRTVLLAAPCSAGIHLCNVPPGFPEAHGTQDSSLGTVLWEAARGACENVPGGPCSPGRLLGSPFPVCFSCVRWSTGICMLPSTPRWFQSTLISERQQLLLWKLVVVFEVRFKVQLSGGYIHTIQKKGDFF